jgi:2-polyprenyl-3-methyl-5-hydroxy-6-metoxy-1,4-benzoquinol methylase
VPRAVSLAELFQLGYYWETKILLTATTLDVFSALETQSCTASETAVKLGTNDRALGLLMNALVAIGLLTKERERYANTDVAQRYLVRNRPGYVGHLLLLHDAEWMTWGRLEQAVRTGRSPVSSHVFNTDPELGANVLAVLDRIGQQSGRSLAEALKLEGVERFLDLGGGAGTNAIACCNLYPKLHATVFDLPQTLKVTERVVKEAGLESRITLLAGDFNRDTLGGPYDVIVMSDILHYQGPELNAVLVRKCAAHLRPAGRLFIKDRFLDESRTSPAWVAAFAVHILVNTEQGRCYTVAEAVGWMKDAGFEAVEDREGTAVVQGVKP